MNFRSFLIQLIAVAVGTGVLFAVLCANFPAVQTHALLGWCSIAGFTAVTMWMYSMGKNALASANKNTFTNVVLLFTMVKMMVSVLVLLSYAKMTNPTDKVYILLFMGIYAVFTAFETSFMMKLARN